MVGTPPAPPTAAEWSALECYLRWAMADDLILPDDDTEAAELADAIRTLDWLRPGPLEEW